jgi:nucleotide-binding universal stress UspA family protein
VKTLMATDGSSEATAALGAAGTLLRQTHNQVDVLCVAPELYPPQTGTRVEARRNRVRNEYQRRISVETDAILKQALRLLSSEGIQANPISRIGSPADEIIRLAGDYNVTVVGARSRYSRSELGLGPVASRVVEYAPGTVLVARELSGETSLRVLIGIDGSLASKNALRTLVSYFDVDEAEITLMHVIEMPWVNLGLEREWFDSRGDVFAKADPEIQLQNEMRVESEEVIEEAHALLEERSYSVVSLIQEGNPATEILGEAESKDYDLIILGTSGVADIKHRLLGSVSAKVAWNASCSVALVKHEQ